MIHLKKVKLMHGTKTRIFNPLLQSILLISFFFSSQTMAMTGTDNYKLPRPVISADFPYNSQFITVLGSRMHYVETGQGDPIIFLHGNPTSSYLWRNILPFAETYGRSIAVDLIGMGQSDKPDIGYTFAEHYAYIEAFINALDLDNITLVVHDWGAALGFNYARLHPDKIKAIAFMEGALPPVFPAPSLMALSEPLQEFFTLLKDPIIGPELVIEQNFFIEQALPGFINRPLSEAEMNAYRAPYIYKASRLPILVWPNEVPIGGEPASVAHILTEINSFMIKTELPILLLYASPGAIVTEIEVDWYQRNIKNIETRFVGQGFHYVQEDQPRAIGSSLADWLRRLNKNDEEDGDDDDD